MLVDRYCRLAVLFAFDGVGLDSKNNKGRVAKWTAAPCQRDRAAGYQDVLLVGMRSELVRRVSSDRKYSDT